MTKYRAKVDVPPSIKKGDVVEFTKPLVDGFKNHFEPAGESEEVTEIEGVEGLDANISRADLKAKADELGLDYASNISTAKLLELVKEKMAEDAGNGDGDSGDDDNQD